MSAGPYAQAAWSYREAGWAGVLPLPAGAKWPPPSGYTGWAGADPSGADVQAWVDGPEGVGNIALRLPLGVYGLDVDAYGAKSGGTALAAAVGRLGALPPTWLVTSRDDGVSGIRLYRAQLPPGRRWRDEPAGHGMGIEAIHFGHRYAVAWPSTHPDTGLTYRWYPPEWFAREGGEVPRPDALPEMPQAWIEALSEQGEVSTAEAASHHETLTVVTGFPARQACERMREARERGLARLREARDGAALHPAGRDATMELVSLGHEGHAGARQGLAEHFSAFVDVRVARGEAQTAAEGEWWRLVRGAVGKLTGAPRSECDCALLSGEGLLFEWAPPSTSGTQTQGDDASGGEGGAGGFDPLDLTEALMARLLSPAQVRALRPPPLLVEGLLTVDSESWLIAKPGSYKTFIALDIAAHVGVGKPWMGRTVKQGSVLYLVAEGAGGMGQRVQAWEQRNGEMTGVRFLPMPVQVKREDHWAALVEVCRRLEPALIVLDTQARITVGLNENDNSEMGEFVEAIGKLRRATGACVLVVHHLGRSGQDARGASAIDGAQDSELRLTKTADRRVVLQTDKQRHLPDDVRVELELFDCELDGGGASLAVGVPLGVAMQMRPWREGLTENEAAIADILHELYSETGGTRQDVRTALRERGQRGEAKYIKSTFDYAWNQLFKKDKIERIEGTQRYVLSPQSSEGTDS